MDSTRNSNSTARSDCQVLVVGAGPTGLVLAAELLARGIKTRLIDKGDGVVLESRASGIHARTLEVFNLMGLVEGFLECGQVTRRFRFYDDGQPLAELDLSLNGSRFGYMLGVPQHETETMLRARVCELGGTVEPRMELVGFEPVDDCVTAQVKDAAGAVRVITADYLVGCDGGHSCVRHELGLTFHGDAYPQDWLLADVHLDWNRPEDEVHAFFRPGGRALICLPLREHRWRLILPFAGDQEGRQPSLDEIQGLVDQRGPGEITVSDPTWLASFRCHRRSTNVYRRGRVLLAGDAVHIHSPAAGQGMNTGITDAHNLAWKLALVASGCSPDWLLDTYGQERGPVAEQVLALTHRVVWLGTLSHPLKRALRNIIVPLASRFPAIQGRAARRMGQIHVAYPSSRLTRSDGGRGAPRPGDRAPDIAVSGPEGATRLHQVLRCRTHVLVVSGAPFLDVLKRPELRPYRGLLEIVSGDFKRARRLLPSRAASVVLVRPDGYIAARGSLNRMPAVLDYLRQLFRTPRAAEVPPGLTSQPNSEGDLVPALAMVAEEPAKRF